MPLFIESLEARRLLADYSFAFHGSMSDTYPDQWTTEPGVVVSPPTGGGESGHLSGASTS